MACLLLSWIPCLYIGHVGSDVSMQRGFAGYLSEHPEQRVWTNGVVAADAIVLSGFDRRLDLGIVRMDRNRVVDAPGLVPSNPIRALRDHTPVAERKTRLAGQLVALPSGVQADDGWTLVETFRPRADRLALAVQGALAALGVPQRLTEKVAPSHGDVIRLFRATAVPAR